MNYRESFAKKRAVEMYYQGMDRSSVVKMLQEEGAGERAEKLADDYFENFNLIKSHHKQQKQKGASGLITIGLVFIAGSVAYGLLTYLALGNGNFVILSGLLVVGAISLFKGMRDKHA